MKEDPEESVWENTPENLQVGSYAYTVLYERARKIKKHPMGFAPAKEVDLEKA